MHPCAWGPRQLSPGIVGSSVLESSLFGNNRCEKKMSWPFVGRCSLPRRILTCIFVVAANTFFSFNPPEVFTRCSPKGRNWSVWAGRDRMSGIGGSALCAAILLEFMGICV